jgi:ferredoxin
LDTNSKEEVNFFNEIIELTGYEPVLGGELTDKAVWVDESRCIGCRYCAHVATNTFIVDDDYGRSRAIRQDGDNLETVQEAIDTCPVDCIHWVEFEKLEDLESSLDRDMFQNMGKPPRMNKH